MGLEGGVLLDNSCLYLGDGRTGGEENGSRKKGGNSYLLHRSVDARVVKLKLMAFIETNP